MSLSKEEVEPGVVATLDTATLCQDPRVQRPGGKKAFRSGLYLCVKIKDGNALWLPLTSRKDERGLRLELERRWRVGGNYGWQRHTSYISDARKPFIGPIDAFVTAAGAVPYYPHHRAYVSDEGLAAVEAEMRKYGEEPISDLVDPADLT